MKVTEYLEVAGRRISREDLPPSQPLFHIGCGIRFKPGEGPERLAAVIGELRAADNWFNMEGGIWTNDI